MNTREIDKALKPYGNWLKIGCTLAAAALLLKWQFFAFSWWG